MTAQFTHEGTRAATDLIASTVPGRLRGTWYRIRFTVQEMNYASRRVVELQAPWSVDRQWQSRQR
jgi:hypothetical protein